MKYVSHHKNLLAALIFFTLIVVGGIALAATNNWENPLAAFTSTALEGGHGAGRDGEGMPPFENAVSADSDASTTMTRPQNGEGMGEGPGRHKADEITWSQFGHVLYNIWFLFAAAGVLMLISLPLRFMRKEIRQRKSISGIISQQP